MPTTETQLLNDVAHGRIIHERRDNGGVFRQVYEGQPGPLSPAARGVLRALISEGLVLDTRENPRGVLVLSPAGKFRWAAAQVAA